ncbi:hypothetical protein [Paracidovorax anthurii]|uniref:Uncharacterized protein n=1 Tax=Paracidovorax anthurii TaxID=78229 RepID=A0A328YHB7_9BURK|nr:hypothetical protein [Paracidovorax anthurii]RAR72664.1 hypothetical protein AX018_108116 [Paracidovorax anthurii]
MAVAIGKMLEYDFRFLGTIHRRISTQQQQDLLRTKSMMTAALWVLWGTGALFVYLGYTHNPDYVMNEKLWMKVLTVSALTLNGMLMHRFAFPHMMREGIFLEFPLKRILTLTLFATVSSVSWLYASFLGIARSWNHAVSFEYTLGIYLMLLTAAGCTSTGLMVLLRRRYAQCPEAFGMRGIAIKRNCPHSS